METLRALEVVDLSCRYRNSSWILKDISFYVRAGESLAIVGPSGSGKTTLAHCISGIIPNRIPAEFRGSIRVDGEDLSSSPIRERISSVGVVLQDYELQIFGLTVEEDLEISLREGGDIEWILEFFGLEKYRDYYTHELSGGLKHRLVVASMMLSDPKYIVMDDPLANLDWNGRRIIAKTVDLLKREGKGVVLLTRKLRGLEDVIDRVIYLGQSNRNPLRGLRIPRMCNGNYEGPVIEFNRVYFKYNKERDYVLKDITLSVRKGEIFAIMGPNGSGKTTLMKHINGLLKPSRGSVIVKGIDTRSVSPASMSKFVGMVFQNPERYFVSETVWDEAAFGARNLGLGEERVEEALRMMGLLDRKEDSPSSLSMGEKIRLYAASVLAMDPEIIVFDEPTTGQDEETLEQMREVIGRLSDSGKTIVIVTHDSDFAVSVADRLAILKDGTIYAEGDPLKLLRDDRLVEEAGIEPLSMRGEVNAS
ncbi:MAG: ATP-binding cassette domain-containing protein [Candidatus Korarchaeum sp.]|nr:ATP-binding cassette domain-containing protein [Candidatus Korarchaeum sp.]